MRAARRLTSPPLVPSSFHAQHAPPGAYLSFTCGAEAEGGLAFASGTPAKQHVLVGLHRGPLGKPAELALMPLHPPGLASGTGAFLVDQHSPSVASNVGSLGPLERRMSLSIDQLTAGDVTLTVFTPVHALPDPETATEAELSEAFRPAVLALLEHHNAQSVPVTLFFALGLQGQTPSPLISGERRGFDTSAGVGLLAEASGATVEPFCRFSLAEALGTGVRWHQLGDVAGVAVEIAPHSTARLRLALGAHHAEPVTRGRVGVQLADAFYRSLAAVLDAALDAAAATLDAAERADARLDTAPLDDEERFFLAQAARSYFGNSQLLTLEREPWWVVLEGEYRMLNTLDLSVDQLFLELELCPWATRNVLERFAEHYAYEDALGVSFAHDMGVGGVFSPSGTSSYEVAGLTGCWSFMTHEQLCNWLLMAASYVHHTEDAAFVERHRALIERAFASLRARSPHGFLEHDSDRCVDGAGARGAEITTYDSLDDSLGPARGSTYLAVKSWAAYLAVELLLGDGRALAAARDASAAIVQLAGADGVLRATREGRTTARVLPLVEGLVYPLHWARLAQGPANEWVDERGPFAALLSALRTHLLECLLDDDRRNHFADGGLRLSSSSANSWLSKLALVQFVARQLGLETNPEVAERLAIARRAHGQWLRVGSAAHAASDQMVEGVARGSRYYPRLVSAWIWLPPQQRRSSREAQ